MIPIIHDEIRLVLTEFYTATKAALAAINPDLQFSANGSAHNGYRGLSLEDVNDEQLFDWYAAQIYRDDIDDFQFLVNNLRNNLPDVAKIAVAGITYSELHPATNEAFLEEVERTLEFGADAEGVFAHFWRNRTIGGETVYELLHNLLPGSAPDEPGDFNLDGNVDGIDLGIWQAGFATGSSLGEGDADADADVDGNDFLIWQRN